MSKANLPSLPNPPTYQSSPYFTGGGIGNLYDLGNRITRGDFTGDLSWLQPTINQNTSANALSYAQGVLQPQFRDTLQQINNQAAANNQLSSSTYTDALARSQSDLNSQYQSLVSQGAINDAYQSNANRLSLFGTGLNTLNSAIGYGGQSEGQQNQFNLNNYSNLVAKSLSDNQRDNAANGWQQALGFFSPIGHDYLQSQGINSVPGYGVADITKIASSFIPSNGGFGGGSTGGQFGGGLNNGGGGLPGLGQQTNPLTGLYRSNPGSSAFNSFGGNQNPFQFGGFNSFYNGLQRP